MSVVAIVLASVIFIACGGGGSNREAAPALDAPGDVPSSTPAPAASVTNAGASPPPPPACAGAKPHTTGDADQHLSSGGLDRTYILHVPPQYDGTRSLPLVLNLHGYGSNARQQAIYSRLPAKGAKEGFIVVSPDGTGDQHHWNYPGLGGVDDIAFVRDLLDRVESDLCVDEKRVFVAGISNGAAFASFVACAMPERITAIAAIAATAYPAACPAAAVIPIISFRGTEDPCVPYNGGTSQCGQRLPVQPAEDAMRAWAQHDGCNPDPSMQPYTDGVRTIAYSECTNDAAAVLFVVEGGGHTWPGSIDVPRLGVTTHKLDATDQLWQFFAAQGNLRR